MSMRVVNIKDRAEQVEERRRALGIDDARFAAARNNGAARTPAKRHLLRVIGDEARRQGRTAPFAARF